MTLEEKVVTRIKEVAGKMGLTYAKRPGKTSGKMYEGLFSGDSTSPLAFVTRNSEVDGVLDIPDTCNSITITLSDKRQGVPRAFIVPKSKVNENWEFDIAGIKCKVYSDAKKNKPEEQFEYVSNETNDTRVGYWNESKDGKSFFINRFRLIVPIE